MAHDSELRWQFADGRSHSGNWTDYDYQHQAILDQAFRDYEEIVNLGYRQRNGATVMQYTVELQSRWQTSLATGVLRTVR